MNKKLAQQTTFFHSFRAEQTYTIKFLVQIWE